MSEGGRIGETIFQEHLYGRELRVVSCIDSRCRLGICCYLFKYKVSQSLRSPQM